MKFFQFFFKHISNVSICIFSNSDRWFIGNEKQACNQTLKVLVGK